MDTAPSILTPDRRLRVFISSTMVELAEERRAAREAIEEMRLHPVMFELGARPHPPRDLYRAYLEQSDIFVGIYFESYGWTAPDMEISGLEDEFVLSERMPRLIYVKDPAPNREPGLKDLLQRISGSGTSYRKFADAQELGKLVHDDLAILLTERFEQARTRPSKPAGSLHTTFMATANRFIGRDRDMSEIERLIVDQDARLITITGAAGVGKSRFALELCAAFKDRFKDGVHFVILETLERAEDVPVELAKSLELIDVLGSVEPRELVFKSLADKELLLVLDNLEHLLPAGPFISELLARCPNLRIIVTSRSVLRLRGELEYFLRPLEVPAQGSTSSDSVELFLARARPSQTADPYEQRQAIAEICRRLDGLPLAIELAAARTSILAPTEILARLERRFDFLKAMTRDLPERQRTMRSAIAWSVDLLSKEDIVFFRRLGVFAGGFTLEAAEAICDPGGELDVLEHMQVLIENSLLQPSREGLDPRFQMMESIREFAGELLEASDEGDELLNRHAEHFLRFVVDSCDDLRGPKQLETLDLLEADDDNIRTALRRLLTLGRAQDIADVGWSLWPYWWMRGRMADGRNFLGEILDPDAGVEPTDRGRARAIYGAMCLFMGDYGTAVASLAQAVEDLRELGDEHGVGLAQAGLGIVSSVMEGPESAMARLKESEELLRKSNDEYGLVLALNSLCWIAMAQDIDSVPDETFIEAMEMSERIGGIVDVAMSKGNWGRRLADRDRIGGLGLLRRTIHMLVEGGMPSAVSLTVDQIAEIASLDGFEDEAVRLYGFAQALRESVGTMTVPALDVRRDRFIKTLRERLGVTKVDKLLHEGSLWDYETGTQKTFEISDRLIDKHGVGAGIAR